MSFILSSYGSKDKPAGLYIFLNQEKPVFVETGGKCNFTLLDKNTLYAPVQKPDGSCFLQAYQLKNNDVTFFNAWPVSALYSHGLLHNNQLILASFSDGKEGLFDLEQKKETASFIHTRKGYEEKGRSHFVGRTPDQKHFFAVDHALQKIYLFDIENDKFMERDGFEFDQEERIRLMPYFKKKDVFFLNTEKTNCIYTLAYSDGQFQILHKTQMPYKPGSFSGGMAFDEDGKYLAISLRGENTLLLYEIEPDASLKLVQPLACKNMPRDVLFENNKLYVSCSLDDVVEIYDLKPGHLEKTGEIEIPNPITFTKF
jgi:6-phosphogluconolactonase (cycloisomerase 2 family)